jgi:hypothetical protein
MEMHNYREEDEEGGGCKPYQALVYLSLDIDTIFITSAYAAPARVRTTRWEELRDLGRQN